MSKTGLVLARRLRGVALLVIGIAKVAFADPASWVPTGVARVYGAAEAAAGVSLVVAPMIGWSRPLAVVLVAAASAVLLLSTAAGFPAAGCGCFGTALRVESPWAHMLISGVVLVPIGLSFLGAAPGEVTKAAERP